MAEKTLRDFSIPSAANVATGPNVDVGDVNFELKSSLINMVQASPFSRTGSQPRLCPLARTPRAERPAASSGNPASPELRSPDPPLLQKSTRLHQLKRQKYNTPNGCMISKSYIVELRDPG